MCVCVCVCLIMRDLENSKPGGLDPSWAVAPQKEKNDDFTGLLKTIDLEIFGYKFTDF